MCFAGSVGINNYIMFIDIPAAKIIGKSGVHPIALLVSCVSYSEHAYVSDHVVQNVLEWDDTKWCNGVWCGDVYDAVIYWCSDVMWWCNDVMMWWLMWWCNDVAMWSTTVFFTMSAVSGVVILMKISFLWTNHWSQHTAASKKIIKTYTHAKSLANSPAELLTSSSDLRHSAALLHHQKSRCSSKKRYPSSKK